MHAESIRTTGFISSCFNKHPHPHTRPHIPPEPRGPSPVANRSSPSSAPATPAAVSTLYVRRRAFFASPVSSFLFSAIGSSSLDLTDRVLHTPGNVVSLSGFTPGNNAHTHNVGSINTGKHTVKLGCMDWHGHTPLVTLTMSIASTRANTVDWHSHTHAP